MAYLEFRSLLSLLSNIGVVQSPNIRAACPHCRASYQRADPVIKAACPHCRASDQRADPVIRASCPHCRGRPCHYIAVELPIVLPNDGTMSNNIYLRVFNLILLLSINY